MTRGPQASCLSHEPRAPLKGEESTPGQLPFLHPRPCDKKAEPPNDTARPPQPPTHKRLYYQAFGSPRGRLPPPPHPPEGCGPEGQHQGPEKASSPPPAPRPPPPPCRPAALPRLAWSSAGVTGVLPAGRTPQRVAAAAGGAASRPSPLHRSPPAPTPGASARRRETPGGLGGGTPPQPGAPAAPPGSRGHRVVQPWAGEVPAASRRNPPGSGPPPPPTAHLHGGESAPGPGGAAMA